jgi:putative addiction module killer protein
MLEVLQYVTDAGKCPFADWFNSLDSRAALKVTAGLARIEGGNLGDVKGVGEGVCERRIDHGPGYRIYFGRHGDQLIILLVGGDKQRQQKDIERAKVFWRDYKKRKLRGI